MTTRGDRTRRTLLEAALALFAKRGFHGVSVPELAAAAGIGAASVYRHYASKEALVNGVIRDRRAALAKAVWSGFEHHRPVRLAFHDLWLRLIGLCRDFTEDVIFLELHHHDDYLEPATVKELQASTFAPLIELLERGQREGIIRKEAAPLLVVAVGGVFVACFKAGLKKGKLVSTTALEQGEALAWSMLQP